MLPPVTPPLQVIDSFLLKYNVGQVLLLAFVLTTVGTLPLKSRRLVALIVTTFGVIFLLTPVSLMPTHYLFLGIALVVVGPMLYVTGDR
jgi:VIT1/CCC1 family predicted Fe2+/Mn2+ transporter